MLLGMLLAALSPGPAGETKSLNIALFSRDETKRSRGRWVIKERAGPDPALGTPIGAAACHY